MPGVAEHKILQEGEDVFSDSFMSIPLDFSVLNDYYSGLYGE